MTENGKTNGRGLRGQVAVVTGANSGIGEAVADCLGAAGADVVINFLDRPEEAERVARRIREHGVKAVPIHADVSREEDVERMFAASVEQLGSVDILVNNAGIQRDAPLLEMTLEDWETVLRVNVTGAFLCTRSAVREFGRQGVRSEHSHAAGKIVFITSVHEIIPWAGHANYAASKGAVSMLMKSAAQELAGVGIRVNAVAPGAIRTEINRWVWDDPQSVDRLRRLIPRGRIGDPIDVGRAVSWLVSEDADYVHGETLFVDGGMTLYPGFRDGAG